MVVSIAAVWPGGRVSRTEIGWLKSALRYAKRMDAEIRMLVTRKPSYFVVRPLYNDLVEVQYNSYITKKNPANEEVEHV